MAFEMQISDIFRLSNGRTVLVGRIFKHNALVGRCQCELRSGTELRQTVDCEGEQIVKKSDPTNDLRSIATEDTVNLSVEEAQSGQWALVCSAVE
jgi:hypothetical protein